MSDTQTGQYLTFALGSEEYGIEILKVQEIRGFSAITPIPNTPAHVKGVMNLRGTVVPVVDLRTRFGMAASAYDRFTVIIVVRVASRIAGLVVDGVSDVLDLAPHEEEPPPSLGSAADAGYLKALGKKGDRLVLLLDIERVVDAEAHATTAEAA